MIRIHCDPSPDITGGRAAKWDYSFDEEEATVEEVALHLRIMLELMGFGPAQMRDVFHEDLLEAWEYPKYEE